MTNTIFLSTLLSLASIILTSGFLQLNVRTGEKHHRTERTSCSSAYAPVTESSDTSTSTKLAIASPSKEKTNIPCTKSKRIIIKGIKEDTRIGTAKSSSYTRIKNNKNRKDNEFQWLHWVYNQWKDTSPLDLTDENIIKQMMLSIPKWSKRKSLQDAIRAEELLERLIQEAIAGNPHMRTGITSKSKPIPPALLTVSLFNAGCDAYAKIGNPDGAQRVLRRMESLRNLVHNGSDVQDFANLQPDEFSMSTLATAWAKSRSEEAAQKAEAILKYMDLKGLRPNTITYNTILHAIAVGNQVDKALKAENIVQRMKHRHKKYGEDCMPDVYTYHALIKAWSRSSLPGAPQKAESILQLMDEAASFNEKLAPNTYCFTTVIHSWARSSEKLKARRAYHLLNVLTQRYYDAKSNYKVQSTRKNKKSVNVLKPNVKTFTSVLNACARPVSELEKKDAFALAKMTMKELSIGTYGRPNFLSFAAYLAVCSSTLDEGIDRDAEVKKVFDECIKAGQVGQIVLEKLHVAASPELLQQLIGSYINDRGEVAIPSHWSALTKGERAGGNYSILTEINDYDMSRMLKSSHLQLNDAQKFGAGISSSFDSSPTIVRHGENEILWSTHTLS